jgi:hypothetical protein
LKLERNKAGIQSSQYYRKGSSKWAYLCNTWRAKFRRGERECYWVSKNVGQETVCAEAWFNELRLSRLDEKGGYAAVGRVDVNLADLGTLSFAGSCQKYRFWNPGAAGKRT